MPNKSETASNAKPSHESYDEKFDRMRQRKSETIQRKDNGVTSPKEEAKVMQMTTAYTPFPDVP